MKCHNLFSRKKKKKNEKKKTTKKQQKYYQLVVCLICTELAQKGIKIKTIVTRAPVSILYKSIAGRYRTVSYPDGPITDRYRFIKNASWGCVLPWILLLFALIIRYRNPGQKHSLSLAALSL